MSVGIKTPTKAQFGHCEFPCGEKRQSPIVGADISNEAQFTEKKTVVSLDDKGQTDQSDAQIDQSETGPLGQGIKRKRRLSEKSGANNNNNNQQNQGPPRKNFKPARHGRPGEKKKISLPTKFLLGGNITDPLNLNSLCVDEIGKALNENTPHSSPLPFPSHKQNVAVLIPPNINDPLNLNSGEDVDLSMISPKVAGKKKKHKHNKKRKSVGEMGDGVAIKETSDAEKPQDEEIPNVDTEPVTPVIELKEKEIESKVASVIDNILSSALPQPIAAVRRPSAKRTLSGSDAKEVSASTSTRSSISDEIEAKAPDEVEKIVSPKPKARRQASHTEQKRQKYIYGNYNRYYGYRNSSSEDARLSYLQKEWIEGKDILDIGCNIGHVTLTLARDYAPKRITGIDIDGKLIGIAKKNIRHYMSEMVTDVGKFPAAMRNTFGPIAAPKLPGPDEMSVFPNNVMFAQGNYLLDKDEQLEMQKEEYDVILALSITKWIHLNWGDDGLKRVFKRMYRQLRPGGKLILEPQSWSSYKKKKKLTETIFKNFQQIRMRPEQFTTYLLSRDVGFSQCQQTEAPYHRAKGFQRPIQVYTKPQTASGTPFGADSRGVTPLMDIECNTPLSTMAGSCTPLKDWASSRGPTPMFDVGSTGITPCSTCPNTPTYLYNTWSGAGTPRNDFETMGRFEGGGGGGGGGGEVSSRGVTARQDALVESRDNAQVDRSAAASAAANHVASPFSRDSPRDAGQGPMDA